MPSRRIAVIEDDPITESVIIDILADEGYAVVAPDPRHGRHAELVEWRPDLVILDLRLERPDGGMALLDALRRNPTTADIPVLVCTADLLFPRDDEGRLQAKGCEVLPKPFDLDALLEKVARLLDPVE